MVTSLTRASACSLVVGGTDTTSSRHSARALGFNAGVDVTFAVWNQLGVGVQVRHTSAIVDFDLQSRNVESKAGGTQVGTGVRWLF